MITEVALRNVEAVNQWGAELAAKLRPSDVVALSGDLGAGKTTLARAILRALGYQGEVPSPSFTIIETYDPPQVVVPVVHADFYRLNHPDERHELGLEEYCEGAILIAEWPGNAGGFSHLASCVDILIKIAGKERLAIVNWGSDWLARINE